MSNAGELQLIKTMVINGCDGDYDDQGANTGNVKVSPGEWQVR